MALSDKQRESVDSSTSEQKQNLKKIDWERVELTREYLIANGKVPHGKECDLVQQFRELFETGHYDPLIPLTGEDTVMYEQSFKYGRADIVVYHCDGSVSVIEAKDGAAGYSCVVAGIGQAGLYAMQIATKAIFKNVRRCLLWSSTGNIELDGLIDLACEHSGVISLPMPSMKEMMAIRESIRQTVEGRSNGSA